MATSLLWLNISENVFIASQNQRENPKGVSDHQGWCELALITSLKCKILKSLVTAR